MLRGTRGLVLPMMAGLLVAGTVSAEVAVTSDTFGALEVRPIGPAVMGGRIAAIDAVATDPVTVYVGAASGGLWRSEDAGTTFEPVFDEHNQSIGAVAVDPSDPDVVWLGTGESWVRNSVSVGDGVYRSTDGGDTWQHLGLQDSERIARIAVSPADGDKVFVCATGHLWDGNEERGVFRTTDGGETWEKVLYVDADTGCSDLSLDPQDPRILYAGMWTFRRQPDFFTSGGPGSGLYRSIDGGDTWQRLSNGLPEGELGRIAVAVAPSRPSVVYAVVESESTALYRSDTAGETWRRLDSSFAVTGRPFYFAYLVVDPEDYGTVYKPGFSLSVSTDGGRSFSSALGGMMGGAVHSDLHALWINPANPNEMFVGTDGGLYVSYDRAHHWRHVNNLPISQFYHVSADDQLPYNVYGGLQDNGSWMAPSRHPGGIRNAQWENIGFGDGFWAFPDPVDPDILYVEYQGGNLMRVRRSLGEVKDIKPYAREGEEELRFNWNTPIHLSPNDPATLYYGSQYLHRSRDRGETWETISPDLTTDDPAKQRQESSGGLTIDNSTAENHTTLYCISESPLDRQVVWVGTDDGNLQLTRDGGRTWANVADNVADLPAGTWVSSVQASRHGAGVAYATFDGHRTGDMAVYAYRTNDFGQTWTSLETEQVEGFARVLREDPERPDLLFLGTEHGLWLSLDGGAAWARFTGKLPRVPVHDLAIQERRGDLVVATHGRGVAILDDLTPIRALDAETMEQAAAVLPSRPAEMPVSAQSWPFAADDEFVGPNPPEAAVITYWLKKRHLFGDLKAEIYDREGTLVSTIPGTKRVGLNRIAWPMRLDPPKVPRATSLIPVFQGPRVAEGVYTVKLVKGKDTFEGTVTLVAEPRSPHSAEERALQQETAMALYRDLADLTFLVDRVESVAAQAEQRSEAAGGRLARELEDLAQALEALRGELVSTSEAGMLAGEERLREKLGGLYGSVNGYDGRPTNSQLEQLEVLERRIGEAEARFAAQTATLGALNRRLERRDLAPITVQTREQWEAEQDGGGPGAPPAVFTEHVEVFALSF